MLKKVKIGTRGSHLALWQAEFTKKRLADAGIEAELIIIKTKGDIIQHLSFDKIEGKGFFTKEIEDALLNGSVDMAVHSMKDLPTENPEGLVVAGVSYRENPADWLLIRPDSVDKTRKFKLKADAVVGTSAARRKAQLLDLCPEITLKDIRGNVPTRVEKLRNGDFDAILLAGAGLTRLQLDISDLEVVHMNIREFIPAPAQGVLAYQCRENDDAVKEVINVLHNEAVAETIGVERRVLKLIGGGCHIPLGVYCEKGENDEFQVWVAHANSSDSPVTRCHLTSESSSGLAENILTRLKVG